MSLKTKFTRLRNKGIKEQKENPVVKAVEKISSIKADELKEASIKTKTPKKWSTSKIVNLCIKFTALVSGKPLYPYQLAFAKGIIKSILDNDGASITALFSRQSGKTEVVSQVATACAILLPTLANQPLFSHDPRFNRYWKDELGNERYSGLKAGLFIGIYAPVDEQAKISFNRIRDFLSSDRAKAVLADVDFNAILDTFNGQNVVIKNRDFSSLIGSYTASEGARIEGKTWHLVIIDESQDVSDYKLLKEIMPMMAYNNGTMVMIGTPGLHKGYFYRASERNKSNQIADPKNRNHYQYDYKEVQRHNPQYKKYVSKSLEELGGSTNDEFRMNFLLQWMLDRGMFILDEEFTNCGKDYEFDEMGGKGLIIVSVDWAKRLDSTIVTVMEVDRSILDPLGRAMKRVLCWYEFQGVMYQQQAMEITDILHKYGANMLVSDETGVGQVATELLETQMPDGCVLERFNFSGAQKQNDLWQRLHIEMIGGRLIYPASHTVKQDLRYKHFCEQMTNLEKDTSKGYIKCLAPTGKDNHDDYCDSLALANFGADQVEDAMEELDMDGEDFETESIYRRH